MDDLISRKALIQEIEPMLTWELLNKINKMPAVDAAPVVHGRWVEWWPPKHMIFTGEEMLYRCSQCDAKYADKENMRFCPNCGARMDGDE